MAQVKALIGNIKGKDGIDGSENQIYSTTEQAIGTWIDGVNHYIRLERADQVLFPQKLSKEEV